MALRLIDTSPARAAAVEAPAAARDTALLDRARGALAANDLPGYRACAAQTADIDDDGRRYSTRRSLVELGLESRPGDSGAVAATSLLATAELALDVLAADPAEPVLLNLAGVALYELDGLRGAEKLFRAARGLDPELEHIEQNLRSLKRRRKSADKVRLPAAVAQARPAVERRAELLAARARPGDVESISLCMIVRDEEAVLDRCLRSVAGVVDEIVVVDTGSTDRTREIAREHGAIVLEHAWNDHFAEARNVGLEAATGAWILFLDADEELAAEDRERLRELTRRTWRHGYRLRINNVVGDDNERHFVVNEALRLFRNRPAYRFDGRVHENVSGRMPAESPERVETTSVTIEHDGYLERSRESKGKADRNLALLERQLAEEGEEPFLLYNLGSEFGALGQFDRAVQHLARAWALFPSDHERGRQPFVPSLAVRYATNLRKAGRNAEAIALAEHGLRLFDGFTDLVLAQGLAERDRGELARAEALLRRCLELGDAPSHYLRTVGAGTFGAATELAGVLLMQGEATEAEALLLDTLAEYPRTLDAIGPLVRAMLGCGRTPDAVRTAVADRIGDLSPYERFALADGFHAAGAAEPAEAELRALLAVEHDDVAQLALAETLLSQSRWAEAAAAAAGVAPDAPCAPKAAVSQAFAAVAAGDGAAVEAALRRAATAGAAPHEQQLLSAWAFEAGLGGTAAAALPPRAFDLLMTSIEALLRVHHFDAFASLLPLLDRVSGLSARERREALAQVYLRRGFVDSAAEEWAAACDELGPDARAMTGLARVAAAKGARDDARVFAEAALELDPSAEDAGNVLAALAA